MANDKLFAQTIRSRPRNARYNGGNLQRILFCLPAMRVLVAEDEKKMAALLRKGLEEEGHSVTLSHSGTEALETALAFAFDVLVLDVMLPGMDGYEVARRVRRNGSQTPILMLTARDAVQDVIKGL